MVVILAPTASANSVWQDLTAWPSSRTVQAPHSPSPHPYLVPVRLRRLRRTESRVSSAGAGTGTLAPLILRYVSLIWELRARLCGGGLVGRRIRQICDCMHPDATRGGIWTTPPRAERPDFLFHYSTISIWLSVHCGCCAAVRDAVPRGVPRAERRDARRDA